MENFLYVSMHQVPSTRANSHQIIDTVKTFSRYRRLEFVTATSDSVGLFAQLGGANLAVSPILRKGRLLKYITLVVHLWRLTNGSTVYTRNTMAALCALAFIRSKVAQVIIECHEPPAYFLLRLIKVIFGKRFKIITISKYLRDEIAEQGLSDVHWVPLSSPGFTGLDQFEGEPVYDCAYAGGAHSGKGLEVLIAAAELNPNLRFLVASDLTGYDFTFPENVVCVGHVEYSKLGTLLSRSRILLAPYQSVIFGAGNRVDISKTISPLKLFDYLSVRRPIIISDLENVRDVVDESHVTFVKPDDPIALSNAIKDILAEYQRYQEKASVGFQHWRHNYTTDGRVREILRCASGS